MSRNVQKFVGIAGYLAVLIMYLPFFLEETDVAIDIIYLAFVLAGGLLAAFTLMDKGRWARWGLLGVIPGVAIGALSVGLYAWIDAQGQNSGWEGLIAFVGVVIGAGAGAVVGAMIGGVAGFVQDQREPETGRG